MQGAGWEQPTVRRDPSSIRLILHVQHSCLIGENGSLECPGRLVQHQKGTKFAEMPVIRRHPHSFNLKALLPPCDSSDTGSSTKFHVVLAFSQDKHRRCHLRQIQGSDCSLSTGDNGRTMIQDERKDRRTNEEQETQRNKKSLWNFVVLMIIRWSPS